MKTMTAASSAAPCDLAHRGETHDDVINAQDQHLKQARRTATTPTSPPVTR